ncbi:MAG: GNAT family N-acetyltransferase, partial [Alphaproteobacteria bacterium]
EGRLIAAAPMYLKSHSQGEYVFDHGWAQAWEQAGGRYYPKLQAAVPFSPVPGPRLLTGGAIDTPRLRQALAAAMMEVARRMDLSSVHVTFCREDEQAALVEAGFLPRLGMQYHWHNDGYETFDDFLGALNSRKRKAIRKERAAVVREGLIVRALNGDDIKPRHWDAFFHFYMDTSDRKWGYPYLTREFFARLGETMANQVVLIMAEDDGQPVAGALNLVGRDCLFGRNWGCIADFRFLHFEACYYQAIDYAIAHGLSRVEAGAQGQHKVQRGYLPVATHSAHWIRDEGFRQAVENFVRREERAMRHEMEAVATQSPFRQEGDGKH